MAIDHDELWKDCLKAALRSRVETIVGRWKHGSASGENRPGSGDMALALVTWLWLPEDALALGTWLRPCVRDQWMFGNGTFMLCWKAWYTSMLLWSIV